MQATPSNEAAFAFYQIVLYIFKKNKTHYYFKLTGIWTLSLLATPRYNREVVSVGFEEDGGGGGAASEREWDEDVGDDSSHKFDEEEGEEKEEDDEEEEDEDHLSGENGQQIHRRYGSGGGGARQTSATVARDGPRSDRASKRPRRHRNGKQPASAAASSISSSIQNPTPKNVGIAGSGTYGGGHRLPTFGGRARASAFRPLAGNVGGGGVIGSASSIPGHAHTHLRHSASPESASELTSAMEETDYDYEDDDGAVGSDVDAHAHAADGAGSTAVGDAAAMPHEAWLPMPVDVVVLRRWVTTCSLAASVLVPGSQSLGRRLDVDAIWRARSFLHSRGGSSAKATTPNGHSRSNNAAVPHLFLRRQLPESSRQQQQSPMPPRNPRGRGTGDSQSKATIKVEAKIKTKIKTKTKTRSKHKPKIEGKKSGDGRSGKSKLSLPSSSLGHSSGAEPQTEDGGLPNPALSSSEDEEVYVYRTEIENETPRLIARIVECSVEELVAMNRKRSVK